MTTLRLAVDDDAANIDLDDGARFRALRLAGRDLLLERGSHRDMWWGAFVMAPWTSLLRAGTVDGFRPEGDDAWHGFVRRCPWRQTDDDSMEVDVESGPFEGLTIAMTVTLGGGGLVLELSARSHARGVAVGLGWHPWFRRTIGGARAELLVPPGTVEQERDDDGQPTGLWREPVGTWNSGARLGGPVTLRYPGVGRVDVDSSLHHAILFEHQEGICVEPTSGPAGELSEVVEPGRPVQLVGTVRWTGE